MACLLGWPCSRGKRAVCKGAMGTTRKRSAGGWILRNGSRSKTIAENHPEVLTNSSTRRGCLPIDRSLSCHRPHTDPPPVWLQPRIIPAPTSHHLSADPRTDPKSTSQSIVKGFSWGWRNAVILLLRGGRCCGVSGAPAGYGTPDAAGGQAVRTWRQRWWRREVGRHGEAETAHPTSLAIG